MAEPPDGQLAELLRQYVDEALTLRYNAELVKPNDTPEMFLRALVDIRQRLDRIEELFAKAIRARGSARRAAEYAKATFEDAFDNAIHTARLANTEEYTSAKERNAEAALTSLDARHNARKAERLASQCDEAVDVLRLTYNGLNGARTDLLAAMKLFTFESAMER